MDRYDVLDDSGRLVYTVDGKVWPFGGSLVMRDRAGAEMLKIAKRPNPFFAAYTLSELSDAEEEPATVSQRFSLKPRFELRAGEELYTVQANLRACDYDIFNRDSSYALIRKRDLRWGETYILSIQDLREAPVFSALAVCIDTALFHKI